MDDKLTEGKRLYLEEEYEDALRELKLDVELEMGDEWVNKGLINSIEGELPVEGQAGVLDFVRHRIKQGNVTESELELLSLLMESSNEGVTYIASLLRDIVEGKTPEQTAESIEPCL